jgi:uncharacterized protein with von Willebrand factor type A (vWA) domain
MIATRRFMACEHGNRYDMRRTLARMTGNNRDLLEIARKRRRERPTDLVLLCDISGSMTRYSRSFLLFAHTLAVRHRAMFAFVFGTRLTNISRRLHKRDADDFLALIAADVEDWDGGTRIAHCLRVFNKEWGRRVLAHNATLILLSDGLERDAGSDLEFEMQRLQRSCRQLIWVNPMLRFDGFEPRASGIRRMLPYVDRFLPAHNIDSLLQLGKLLEGVRSQRGLAA